MSKFHFHTREIGAVHIFDLGGSPVTTSNDEVQDVAWRMQKSIRRHRLQRVILNMKSVESLDAVTLRKIIAACIRPKQSVIYGAAHEILDLIKENHLPAHIGICTNERDVAEKLGTFLIDKDESKRVVQPIPNLNMTVGHEIERRRSHRMHVALPLEIKVISSDQQPVVTTSIATNISECGLYAEYLDLDAAEKIETVDSLVGKKAHLHIFPSAYFPEEFDVNGIIRRKEVRGKQLGIGIEFEAR